MPQHELKLKKGAPVILLRNINTRLGLVNGTRMIVDEIKKHVIWVIPVGDNKYLPKRWPLHRMMFTPTNVLSREQCFVRTQFPIRLGFSVTCNKAQGQTLERVGILLRTPCFSHGQLYVALSRVRRSTDLYIYNANGINEKDPKKKLRRRKETNNVVYSEAVHWLLPKKN